MQTLVESFFGQAKATPERIFLVQPVMNSDEWIEISYGEAAQQVLAVASRLVSYQLQKGDRVAILSKNCAQWILADLAIMSMGGVTVPIFASLSPEAVCKILEHSEAKGIFIGRTDLHLDCEKLQWGTRPSIFLPQISGGCRIGWDEACKTAILQDLPLKRSLDDLASIFYTSGTTGQMKGVMQPFKSFAWANETIKKDFLEIKDGERFFSYLPLAHVAERTLVETLPVYRGGTIYFNDSLKTFSRDILKANPTIFLPYPAFGPSFASSSLQK